tara:strand:+ start:990 stop:1223 length:234 start_codon:yes stop_codon:yes gene_type:complete
VIDGRFNLTPAYKSRDLRKVDPVDCKNDLPEREKNDYKEFYTYADHEDYLVKGELITYNKYGNLVVYEATKHAGKHV